MSDSKANVCGQAYALTVMTPVIRGHESRLARALDALPVGPDSPLARVPGTHFARWVLIDNVVYQGGRQRRDSLRAARLLFTSNFDGAQQGGRDAYLTALHEGLSDCADTIWGHCEGYTPGGDARVFAGYLTAHQLTTSLFFGAYPELTVEEVRSSLDARRRLLALAMRTRGVRAAELKAEFLAEFGQ
jgi:hypothetical protein